MQQACHQKFSEGQGTPRRKGLAHLSLQSCNILSPAGGLHGWDFAHCFPRMPFPGCLKSFALTSLLPWPRHAQKAPGPKQKAQMAQSNCFVSCTRFTAVNAYTGIGVLARCRHAIGKVLQQAGPQWTHPLCLSDAAAAACMLPLLSFPFCLHATK